MNRAYAAPWPVAYTPEPGSEFRRLHHDAELEMKSRTHAAGAQAMYVAIAAAQQSPVA
jgi:hypothetical protein